MKTLTLVCVVWGLMLLSTAATAVEPPDSLWSCNFGGIHIEYCLCAQQTSDSGYVLAGHTSSFGAGHYDFWLVKTDVNGVQLWDRTFGGSRGDYCFAGQQTLDGGYVLAGHTESFPEWDYNFWLVKTDRNGDSLWSHTFGGIYTDQCFSAVQTSDGGYILAGETQSFGAGNCDFWLVKTDANGDSLWSRTYGGGSGEYCYSIQQTSDSGYIAGGYTYSFGAGAADVWLVKTDASGDSLWSRTFGGAHYDACFCVQQTIDGGYILTGYTEPSGAGDYELWLVKTDANGDSVWSRSFGGSDWDVGFSVQQTWDGGYIVAGFTESFGAGDEDFWLIRTDGSGDSLWSCTFGGSEDDRCECVQPTLDGGYILAGYTASFATWPVDIDFWLVKTGPDLMPESPYNTTVYLNQTGTCPVLRWVAPYECDYLIYSTVNPNHDGDPPGPDWTLEVTLSDVPAGPASWTDSDGFSERYRNYVVVTSCP